MKLGIVLPYFNPYVGEEKLFYNLALELLERGYEVRRTKRYWADNLIHATGFFVYEQ